MDSSVDQPVRVEVPWKDDMLKPVDLDDDDAKLSEHHASEGKQKDYASYFIIIFLNFLFKKYLFKKNILLDYSL